MGYESGHTAENPGQSMVCNGGRTHVEKVMVTEILTANPEMSKEEALGYKKAPGLQNRLQVVQERS